MGMLCRSRTSRINMNYHNDCVPAQLVQSNLILRVSSTLGRCRRDATLREQTDTLNALIIALSFWKAAQCWRVGRVSWGSWFGSC
jgi:hypothetical protein